MFDPVEASKQTNRIFGRKINIAHCVGVFVAGCGGGIYSDRSHESKSNYPGNCTISEQRDGYKCETEGERNEMKGGKDWARHIESYISAAGRVVTNSTRVCMKLRGTVTAE